MNFLVFLALLPPLWQDVAELKAVLQSEELGKVIQSGEAIESIDRISKGWEIETNKGTYEIEVISQPQSTPGPEKFDLKIKKTADD